MAMFTESPLCMCVRDPVLQGSSFKDILFKGGKTESAFSLTSRQKSNWLAGLLCFPSLQPPPRAVHSTAPGSKRHRPLRMKQTPGLAPFPCVPTRGHIHAHKHTHSHTHKRGEKPI